MVVSLLKLSFHISQILRFARGSTKHVIEKGQEYDSFAVCLTANEAKAIADKTVDELKRSIVAGSIEGKLQASRQFLKRGVQTANPVQAVSSLFLYTFNFMIG